MPTTCLYHFDEPVSPHLAVQRALNSTSISTKKSNSSGSIVRKFPTDSEFVKRVRGYVDGFAGDLKKGKGRGALYIESAGGSFLAVDYHYRFYPLIHLC